nr:SLATT domain-containing protein [Halobacterium sp. CBA1126]
MHGIIYTYKTHYKMGEVYEKVDRVIDYSVALLTGLLAVLLVWGAGKNEHLIGIAIITSLLSWASSVANLGVKSQKHYEAGDGYHSLFEDFRDYAKLEVPANDLSLSTKKKRFDELTQRRRDLKKHTPRTTNLWFGKVKESDVMSDVETDEEEMETLLGEISS